MGTRKSITLPMNASPDTLLMRLPLELNLMIGISAGYTIGPIEIEEALKKHPAVLEVAVVGSPDRERGEVVKAFIKANRNPSEQLKEEIQEFVKANLSKHEYPREIEFLAELPKTPDGKIRRKELREQERMRKANR